jgi:cytochrome c oxidase assembly protein subunit 15
MTRALARPDTQHRAIRLWLIAVAALVFVMVLVGGATRLTESGLSIVEWRPVAGVMPPLSAGEWQSEYEKYQRIPQYRALNAGMTLAQFKTIYWWEWTHRLLGRLIGVVFLVPFLYFLWRGWVDRRLRAPLATIFALGAVQGGVGWWMVASGLADRIEVSHYRLAIHLLLASLIFVATLWIAQRLKPAASIVVPARIRAGAISLVVLLLLQVHLGALLAGLRGGLVYNTWPLIDGELIPGLPALFALEPMWRNFFENALTVQFDHRSIAYVLCALAVLHALDAALTLRGGPVLAGALAVAAGMAIQAMLGVLTLVYQVPIVLALAHQAMALVVLAIAVVHAEQLHPRSDPRRPFAPAISPPFVVRS